MIEVETSIMQADIQHNKKNMNNLFACNYRQCHRQQTTPIFQLPTQHTVSSKIFSGCILAST